MCIFNNDIITNSPYLKLVALFSSPVYRLAFARRKTLAKLRLCSNEANGLFRIPFKQNFFTLIGQVQSYSGTC